MFKHEFLSLKLINKVRCLIRYSIFQIILIGGINIFCLPVLADKSSEEKIKAAYTYQFIKFVSWPTGTLSQSAPFLICTLGRTPISKELKPLNLRFYKNHPIKVVNVKKLQDTNGCSILYISKVNKNKLNDIFIYIKNKPVLTVSSIDDFADSGGIIGLVTSNSKIRIEINLASAQRANIKISAKLLEIASVIKELSNKEEQP